uniref:Uncharacterized protein n=1 Tax=Arundo donax TaxID=35708 RepID=A0A0A9ADS5_ARUDO
MSIYKCPYMWSTLVIFLVVCCRQVRRISQA